MLEIKKKKFVSQIENTKLCVYHVEKYKGKDNARYKSFSILDGDKVVGYATYFYSYNQLYDSCESLDSTVYIEFIRIEDPLKRKKYGTKLMNLLIEHIRNNTDKKVIQLKAYDELVDNFYKNLGFKKIIFPKTLDYKNKLESRLTWLQLEL